MLLCSASAWTKRATLRVGSSAEGCLILGDALNHPGSPQPPHFSFRVFALFFPSSYLCPRGHIPGRSSVLGWQEGRNPL